MIEQFLDSIQGIITYELPKDAQGNPVVYDRKIVGWYYGDTDISGAKDPSVIFIASSGTPKPKGFGVKEIEHKVTIKLFVAAASVEKGDRTILEFTRNVYEALLPHTYIWALVPCPICRKKIMSPQHFSIAHSDILSSYMTAAQTDADTIWEATHPNTIPAPTLSDSGLAADAYLRMIEDVRNEVAVDNLEEQARKNIVKNLETYRRPIRLMYDVSLSDVKDTDGGVGKENLHGAEFTLTAKELIRQLSFGPDNVPTGTYALQLNK